MNLDINHIKAGSSLKLDGFNISKFKALNIPKKYSFAFSVNKNERGYVESENDYSASYETDGNNSTSTTKLSISPNWYKTIQFMGTDNTYKSLKVPVLTESDIWNVGDYYKQLEQLYDSLSPRIMFPTKGMVDENVQLTFGSENINLLLCSNEKYGKDISFKKQSSLLSYFNIILQKSNYTLLEFPLQLSQYLTIKDGAWIELNGDKYLLAIIEDFDPEEKSNTTLTLFK